MQRWQIGDIRLTRVEETCEPMFAAGFLLPDLDRKVLADEAWLTPDHYDPASDKWVMGCHNWIVEAGGEVIVIDTCVGNDKTRKGTADFPDWDHLSLPYLDRFRESGISPDRVDRVIFTHLHVDHVGWNTQWDGDQWVPTFRNARYQFARTEFGHWDKENAKDPAKPVGMGSFNDSVLPIMGAGRGEVVDDDAIRGDGVSSFMAVGHSPGHQVIVLQSKGEMAVVMGDVMHHPIQALYPEWNCRFDIWPEKAAESRRRVLDFAADNRALLLPSHFASPFCARVLRDGSRYKLDWVAAAG